MEPSSSTPPQDNEVFLSFRGEDTRNNFVSHLYAALRQRGIITFFDEKSLKQGQRISPELLKSIEHSKFAIIVFSENYVTSTWCLDELVMIMDCSSKSSLTVIPIFYGIDPADIRKLNNSFAHSFAKHEANKDNMEKVQIWKKKLKEAANISGHVLSNGNVDEASLITKIAEEILSNLPPKTSAEGLFGIEKSMEELRLQLAKDPDSVCFVGIWGMGGIGKTTIANAIFHELLNRFEGGCFLKDVSKEKNVMNLKKTLLSTVLRTEIKDLHLNNQGSTMIKDRLRSKKVLLVLDNVDNITQLELLASNSKWFGNGSRIIVTTRDKQLLNNVNELYEIKKLPYNKAIQLFCWRAFGSSHPPEKFVTLSRSFVSYADGVPLALKVLGSHLSTTRNEDIWRRTLKRLEDEPDKSIIGALKISFHGLSHTQQNIFLDIACFFRGHYKDKKENYYVVCDNVNKKLDSFGFHPVVGITDLIDKSLIHISSKGEIEMHDLVQEMGRDIVRQKADMRPGRYSRLWDSKDIKEVLTNDMGTEEVEALVLGHSCEELVHRDARDEALRSMTFELVSDHDKMELISEGVFRKMNSLRLLILHKGNLEVAPNYLPNSLRWLSWWKYPGQFLPINFRPTNLVSLNLSWSQNLEIFPDISFMPNLEFLNLSNCINLLNVHPSVKFHTKLVELNLNNCSELDKFPSIIQMESLETLRLRNCSSLQRFPEFHRNMICLRTLELDFISIKELSWTIGRLTSLQDISMEGYNDKKFDGSKFLTLLLSLPSIQVVKMCGCNVTKIILPERIGCLTSLRVLDLLSNDTVSLPETMNHFSSLLVLRLSGPKINKLPQFPLNIMVLDLMECRKLMPIPRLVHLLDKYANCRELSLNSRYIDELSDLLFFDWGIFTNCLGKRLEVLQITVAHEYFNWTYEEMGPQASVTLSSSWYSNKLRGFLIFATLRSTPNLTVRAIDGLVEIKPYNSSLPYGKAGEQTTFLYIPIGKITSCKDWYEQKGCCLLEVTNFGHVESWGIRLVYEGITDNYIISDLNRRYTHEYCSTLEVCVTPGNINTM